MPATPTPPRCIIADDLRASRELLRAWITECGYKCTTVSNGCDAWAAVNHAHPQLIVSDIEMPVASGLDLLCSLRKHASTDFQSIPVIVISSLRDDDIRSFVDEAGGTFFLAKPLNKKVTQRVVRGLHDLASIKNDEFLWRPEEPIESAKQISPTLRRLYREVLEKGPKFR
ncbi:Sensory/regulatory protein RpfC [Novipirellula galeiformis]|uniref:Sensory/regulatory protein RpfC n=1 Tax=Novipirellula galeiformis TaxID=2528004 RepID=A0A5C6C0E4_9BACT|nr:response regulator [Novipirellula galeiformis]TWU17572.1 Sensory/regulatory protein RpfC [Novipirellula galeiformis]